MDQHHVDEGELYVFGKVLPLAAYMVPSLEDQLFELLSVFWSFTYDCHKGLLEQDVEAVEAGFGFEFFKFLLDKGQLFLIRVLVSQSFINNIKQLSWIVE